MRKRTILSLLGMSFALALGAVGALRASARVQVKEASAANIDTSTEFYLEGTFNGANCWNTDDTVRKFQAKANEAYLFWTLKVGDTFKVYNKTDNKWAGWSGGTFSSNFKQAASDDNIEVLTGGTYKFTLGNNFRTYENISYAWTAESIQLVSGMHVWATSDNANWISSDSTTKLGFWSSSVNYQVIAADYSFTGVDSTELIYYRYTIPTDTTGIKFLRYSTNGADYWNSATGDINTVTANELYYLWYADGWNNPSSSVGSAKDGSFTAEAFGKAIDAIQTCNSDTKIGYGAYPKINSNFYSKLAASANLASVSLSDYSKTDYDNNTKSYNGISKSITVTVQEKWNMIQTKYSAGNGSQMINPVFNNGTASTIIIVISTLSITALGLFFFLKKRKESK